jgi:hypothetical protein
VRLSVPLLTVAGTVAGTAAAVVAYQSAASVGSAGTEPASVQTDQPAAVTTTWLPCEDGWKRVGKACVREKEKVVVVHDLPAPAAPQTRAASGSSHGSARDHAGDDDSAEAEYAGEDDQSEHAGEVEDQSDDAEHAGDDDSGHEDVGDDD